MSRLQASTENTCEGNREANHEYAPIEKISESW